MPGKGSRQGDTGNVHFIVLLKVLGERQGHRRASVVVGDEDNVLAKYEKVLTEDMHVDVSACCRGRRYFESGLSDGRTLRHSTRECARHSAPASKQPYIVQSYLGIAWHDLAR